MVSILVTTFIYATIHELELPKITQKNGLPPLRFHVLRHTNATLLLQEGSAMKDVQGWLGHASMSTTADYYAHVTDEGKQNSLNQSVLP